jgi:hypothetical protein
MADIMKCKVEGFIAFYIQMSAHFKAKHPDLDLTKNTEVLGNSNEDYKRLGYRPNIRYYRAKFAGQDVYPGDFEKYGKFEKKDS